MNIESSMIEYYDRRAGELEKVYEKPERQAELAQLKDMVRTTLAGKAVLEVACGTGYWTAVAAETASSIVAFDLSEAMLNFARKKPLDPDRVTFLTGDAYRFPPLPRRFERGLVAFLWSHIPKARLREFLRELRSAMQPGAVALVLDNTYVEGGSTPISRRDADGNTFQLRRLADGGTFEVVKNHPTERELRAAAAAVACHVEVRWLKHYWCMTCTFA